VLISGQNGNEFRVFLGLRLDCISWQKWNKFSFYRLWTWLVKIVWQKKMNFVCFSDFGLDGEISKRKEGDGRRADQRAAVHHLRRLSRDRHDERVRQPRHLWIFGKTSPMAPTTSNILLLTIMSMKFVSSSGPKSNIKTSIIN
jgi:hypothetical protein